MNGLDKVDELRVAVIGSGPAGLYAASALTDLDNVSVDVIDRLPTPFGLVRYGVAPDHFKIKSVADTLRKVLQRDRVRFLGNVTFGVDLSIADLHQHYDAFVVANGAALDRRLGVPGEDLSGSFSATDFVAWYSGHPDTAIERFSLAARAVAVIGVGNVAVDIVRILAKTAAELRATDMPDTVLDVLAASQLEDLHLIGRRGPAYAKFTTKELRELGELTNADVIVDPDDLVVDDEARAVLDGSPNARRNLEVLEAWAQREPSGRPRRIHLRFGLSPVEITGAREVDGIVLTGRAGSGNTVLPVQMVLRAIGYRGSAVPGLPFDDERGVIPNDAGRILRDGVPSDREYVAGWIKRGPTGVIGTNKGDATETVRSLLEDGPGRRARASERRPDAILDLLRSRSVHVVDQRGWDAIDRNEIARGLARDAERVKIAELHLLLAAALQGQNESP
ncbi:FAD-dependent oxidoreductase [Jatrophihabitans sp.]|uniref:FAD-dependent oxidoreductase n=1 Tax=Jatrophihabitans sp. TaxID=1932789 RepID=UPI0030C6C158|nr:FAD-dependent pyridine nucleotide-disulfide oxidoreductase [Jatrophihabitans sp.]